MKMKNQKLLEKHVRSVKVDNFGKIWIYLKNGILISFGDDDEKETDIHISSMDDEETLSIYIHDEDEYEETTYKHFKTVDFRRKEH